MTAIKLPRIHYHRCRGRLSRYVYSVGNAIPGNFITTLAKVDLETLQRNSWNEEGCYLSEPVGVAAPEATKEDDGVILSVILDAKQESRSFCSWR